jgi:plastocyanin
VALVVHAARYAPVAVPASLENELSLNKPGHHGRRTTGMSFKRISLTLAVFAALGAAATANAATPKLTGETGPGYTIQVKAGSTKVKTLKAGTYTIEVEDKSAIHNFHLIGPGVNKSTGISFTGETTWKVKLKAGKYTYQCDAHAFEGMKGTFKVT